MHRYTGNNWRILLQQLEQLLSTPLSIHNTFLATVCHGIGIFVSDLSQWREQHSKSNWTETVQSAPLAFLLGRTNESILLMPIISNNEGQRATI